jgi:site-specific DNA recombinase
METQSTPVTAAAIYCRISQDRNGDGLGVERQETFCRELAQRKGWDVAEVYTDNDRSAYSGKPRPEYERMLTDIAAGRRDAVLVVDTDRLTRQPRELEDFIVLADRHGIALANVSGDMDLSSSDGRFRARILGAVARQESEKKSERIRRQREQMALAGRPHPGPRAFGFEDENATLRESEARLIRTAAAAILAGRSIRSVADEWNALGIATARGRRWTINSVRDVLVRPRNVGQRRHQGEVIGAGDWPAILDVETHERLCAIVTRRKRRTGRPATRLLSGIVVCSVCEGPMRSSTNKGAATYACRRVAGQQDGSCGRLSVVADPLDEFVRDMIFAAVDDGDLADRVAARRGDRRHGDLAVGLRADEEALEQLTQDHYVDRIIDRGEFLRARQNLQDRIARTRTLVEAYAATNVLARLPRDAAGLRAWWNAADQRERRQVIEQLLVRVPILPAEVHAPRQFDPARIDVDGIIWRV